MMRNIDIHPESKAALLPTWTKSLLVVFVHYCFVKIGMSLVLSYGIASPVWPASGVAFASLVIMGWRFWPLIFISTFLASLQSTHVPLISFFIAASETAEALVGAYLFTKFNLKGDLSRTKDIVGFLFFGAILSTLFGAFCGITSLHLIRQVTSANYLRETVTWWLGDILGDLIVAPVILVWIFPSDQKPSSQHIVERFILFALTFLTSIMIFHKESVPYLNSHLFTYFIFPFLIWGGLRFNQRTVSILTFMIATVAVTATFLSNQPLIWKDAVNTLFVLIPFLGILSVTALLFTSVVNEHKQTHKNLAFAIQSRDDVLAMVSHDLQNPLSSVLLNLDFLIKKASDLDLDQIIKKVEKTRVVAKSMQVLIGNALDIGTTDKSGFSIDPHAESPKDIVEECVEMLKPLAEAKRIKLKTILDDVGFKILCDHEKILRVLSNLIGNAIKFTPKEGSIVVAIKSNFNKCIFSVRDSGKGINTTELPHLFDRFWQAKKKNKDGTGLGLSIAKGIIEAHRGEIWVESNPGLGSVFYFTLPIGG